MVAADGRGAVADAASVRASSPAATPTIGARWDRADVGRSLHRDRRPVRRRPRAVRRGDAAAHPGGRRRSTRRRITEALYGPADAEPDLILVLGPPNRLPPSLVWELAYGELVFLDVALG